MTRNDMTEMQFVMSGKNTFSPSLEVSRSLEARTSSAGAAGTQCTSIKKSRQAKHYYHVRPAHTVCNAVSPLWHAS